MGKKRLILLEICLIQVIKAYLEKMIFVYSSLTTCDIDLESTQLLLDMLLIFHGVLTQ